MAKDLFSKQSSSYAGFRPGYPASIIDHILQFTPGRNTAWDCATGNGQAAILLSPYFEQVVATDLSQQQLDNAIKQDNIIYRQASAEQSGLPDCSVDLITIAQAYHWFNFPHFEAEARRVSRPDATIAIWGYGLLYTSDSALNEKIQSLYKDVLGEYWDKERGHVDQHYASTPFPFEPLPGLDTTMQYQWNRAQFHGFFNSWSSVQHYIHENSTDPIAPWIASIGHLLDKPLEVFFPVFLKLGRIGGEK
jgi:hypothetical protein